MITWALTINLTVVNDSTFWQFREHNNLERKRAMTVIS